MPNPDQCPDIMAIGNLNMDLIFRQSKGPHSGKRQTGEYYSLLPGGNIANQAVAAARAGSSVALLGRVGSDAFGSQLRDTLLGEGIDCRRMRESPEQCTGLSLILGKEGSENTHIDVWGANALVDEEDMVENRDSIGASRVLLTGLGIPRPAVIKAMEIASGGGAQIIFSSNQSASLPDQAFGLIDILVIDDNEIGPLVDFPIDNLKSARIAASLLLNKGVRSAVLVRLVGKCLLVATDEGFTTIRHPSRHKLVDVTASEDTLAGTLAARLAQGDSLYDAVELAYEASTLCSSRQGAQASIPSRQELLDIVENSRGNGMK